MDLRLTPEEIKTFMLKNDALEVIAANHDPEEVAPIWKTIMDDTFGYKSHNHYDYKFNNGDDLHLTMARSFPQDRIIMMNGFNTKPDSLTQTEDEIKARIDDGEQDSCCWRLIGSRIDPESKSTTMFEHFYTICPRRNKLTA